MRPFRRRIHVPLCHSAKLARQAGVAPTSLELEPRVYRFEDYRRMKISWYLQQDSNLQPEGPAPKAGAFASFAMQALVDQVGFEPTLYAP